MPLGIVTEEEIVKDLENIVNRKKPVDTVLPARVDKMITPGRTEGKANTPDSVRKIIADAHLNGVPAKELSETFNVSPSSVSAYANGATSTATYNEPDKDLKNHVNRTTERIITKANTRIIRALNELTSDKIRDSKAREIAGIAKDMSSVIKNLSPDKNEPGNQNNIQFVIFAPAMKKESDYETIEVVDAE